MEDELSYKFIPSHVLAFPEYVKVKKNTAIRFCTWGSKIEKVGAGSGKRKHLSKKNTTDTSVGCE